MNKHFQLFVAIGLLVSQGCSNTPTTQTESVYQEPSTEKSYSTKEAPDNQNGTYVYNEENFEARITISGSSWSGVTTLYGETQYDYGVVSGNSIYDESGLVEIGYITGAGLVTTIGSSRVTLSKR